MFDSIRDIVEFFVYKSESVNPADEKAQFTVRISAERALDLDAMAKTFKVSKTALATYILEAGINDLLRELPDGYMPSEAE